MSPFVTLPRLRTLLFAAVLGLAAALTGLAPSADGDIWWHLAAGREMVARGGLLFTDPFSVSAAGRAWPDVHWLFQLAVYGVHQVLGLAGLVWVKCALIGVGACLLYFAIEERRGSWVRGVLATSLVGSLLAARSLLLVRPVIGTLVLLAFFFLQLERFRRDGRLRHLLVLPVAQLVWANFQGLSAIGPFVVGAYALGAVGWASLGRKRAWPFAREGRGGTLADWPRARQLLLTLGCCLAAMCVTPFGVRGAALPAVLLGRLLPGEHQVFAQQVAENLPPFELERLSGGEFWHFKWYLALLGVSVLAAGRRLLLSHALLLVGFAGLALLSNRNVLLLYWLGAPLLAINLAPALRRVAAHGGRPALRGAWGLNAALLGGLACVSVSAAAKESTLAEPSPFRAPAGSALRLAALPSADVFSADHFGGYLIWRLYPRFKPYIDTRLVLRSADEFAEYLRLADEPERFDAFQARHRFGYVVLPVLFPERYQRLIAHLYGSPAWKLLFTDGSEVLFGRRDLTPDVAEQPLDNAAETERLLAQLEQRFASAPKLHDAARVSLATLHGALGQFAQAERALGGVGGAEAQALQARLRFAAGDLATAERLAQQGLRADREDVGSLNLMARVALRRGENAQGLGLLRRALRLRPFDQEATQLLAQLEESRR